MRVSSFYNFTINSKTILRLHERQDVEVQNLMYNSQFLSFEIFDFSSPGKYFDIPSHGLKLSKFLNSWSSLTGSLITLPSSSSNLT